MTDDSARRLAAAILLRAVKDARLTPQREKRAAVEFLRSREAASLADALDIPPDRLLQHHQQAADPARSKAR